MLGEAGVRISSPIGDEKGIRGMCWAARWVGCGSGPASDVIVIVRRALGRAGAGLECSTDELRLRKEYDMHVHWVAVNRCLYISHLVIKRILGGSRSVRILVVPPGLPTIGP